MTAELWQTRGTVSGRVQGVGFRAFVEREARALGLWGWVRNLSDGRVELAACGASPGLDALERCLETGPPLARVKQVALEPRVRAGEEDVASFHERFEARFV